MKKLLLFLPLVWLCSCGSDTNTPEETDNYDRQAMLANWADNIIIPAYENYVSNLEGLVSSSQTFVGDPSVANLQSLRNDWKDAYLAWQWVEMYEIGEAELLRLQGLTNTYPPDPQEIETIIAAGEYNLDLPSRRNQQGFPAIDYLINGLADTDQGTVDTFAQTQYQTFLMDLVNRLNDLTSQVLTDWKDSYRDEFVLNSGSSATASVNKLTNDYVFYYEKFVRAAKIGIPAGVFSGTKDQATVEAYYQNDFSKTLFNEALNAAQDFFNGKHFSSSTTGEGYASYLDYLREIQGGDDLKQMINDQFDVARATGSGLADSFAEQVVSNNVLMLQTYDDLQENVVLLKVDMLQSLDIRVDYVDADGD